jgi:hypothetical protein
MKSLKGFDWTSFALMLLCTGLGMILFLCFARLCNP